MRKKTQIQQTRSGKRKIWRHRSQVIAFGRTRKFENKGSREKIWQSFGLAH